MSSRITIPIPSYDSAITSLVVDLERLKGRVLSGTTHPGLFFQIKQVFHLLESLGSARIEGNRTTVEELLEATVAGTRDATEQLREISNIEDAMSWIESVFRAEPLARIDKAFLSELHRLVVKNLRPPEQGGEGDAKPGSFRSRSVSIRGASHVPPSPFELDEHLHAFTEFINAPFDLRYDLLRIAIAHHRCEYIHPFRNGNGRVGRLLTYAMLVRAGFRVHNGRILNPSAIFCSDRSTYMDALSQADSGQDADILAWCEFVLGGLHREITKIDRLLNADVLHVEVLKPAIALAHTRRDISDIDFEILSAIAKEQIVDAKLFQRFYPTRSASSVSQVIARFKQRQLLIAYPEQHSRTYMVNYLGKDLLRPLITSLADAGFVTLP